MTKKEEYLDLQIFFHFSVHLDIELDEPDTQNLHLIPISMSMYNIGQTKTDTTLLGLKLPNDDGLIGIR